MVFVFIPLMQSAAEAGIIERWLAAAGQEPDAWRRAEYASLAKVLVDLRDWSEPWKRALKEWDMRRISDHQRVETRRGRGELAANPAVPTRATLRRIAAGSAAADRGYVGPGTTRVGPQAGCPTPQARRPPAVG